MLTDKDILEVGNALEAGGFSHSDIDAYLEHYGVKGMKWGVRKEKSRKTESDRDVVLKRGQEFRNVSKNSPRSLDGHIYTSHTKRDNAYYRGGYAQTLKMFLGADKVFDNTFVATKDIIVPSKKKSVDAFKELYNESPETMAKALATTKVTTSTARLVASKLGVKVEDRYTKKYSDLGEEALKSDSMQKLMSQTITFDAPVRQKYFDRLSSKGYNAVVDENDKSGGADLPLIVFRGKDSLKRTRSVEISDAEMQVAMEEYTRLTKDRGK